MALSSESSPAVVAAMIRRLALSREQAKKVSASGRPVDRALKKLTEARFLRPSQVYHLLVDLPDEALVLLLAKQLVAGPSARVVRLKRYLTSYMKSRMLRIVLTGHDLQALGLQPGPQYAVVLGQLLDGRIDGVIASEGDERDFVLKRYGRFAYRGIVSLAR
ncbi:MAG: hypothetical protein OEV08_14565, partial [Nitrospira sp.]|nr:hypothetical protein [Nitrospira sp.]